MEIKKDDVLDIIENVGGKQNISMLTHCVTRLRFVLKDESLVNEEALKQNELVQGCFNTNGQFQVIIGPGLVDRVYDECLKYTDAKEASKEELKEVEEKNMNPLQRAIKIFADVFYPILPAIVGAGLLLGISNVLSNPGIFGELSVIEMYPAIAGLADMIDMIANTSFTYIPVMVAWLATKRFGGSPLLGILLGLVLINADLIPGSQMSSVITGDVDAQYWNILGLQILKIGYQNSVLPALIASYLLAKLEGWLRKVIPDSMQLIFVAPIAIFVTAFFTFLCIGPAANQIASWITDGIVYLFDIAPILAGFVFGALYAPLVVTGMHHAIIAVCIQIVASTQQSGMVAIITIVCIAEAGSVLALSRFLKTKNERNMAVSAGVTAILGVTEPSMFGFTIPARYPFICTILSAGISGALMMAFGVYAVSLGPSGPLAFTIIPVQYWVPLYACMILAFVLAFAGTYIIGKSQQKKELQTQDIDEEEIETINDVIIKSSVKGTTIALKNTKDQTFASESLGKGIAIDPTDSKIVAPFNCEVIMLFPTNHAIGLRHKSGLEILIHIGVDTVELNGECFESLVEKGSIVKEGTPLINFDLKSLKEKGYDMTIFMVITNSQVCGTIESNDNQKVNALTPIVSIK